MPSPDSPGPGVPFRARGARRRPGWFPAVVAVLLGVGVGVVGTVLHLNFSWVGGPGVADGAWVLPWGALLALLLTASTQLWWTLRSAIPWAGGVLAIAAFTTVMVVSRWPGLDSLAVGANEYTLAAVPGPAIAGLVWTWGLPVVAVITMFAAAPLLRHPATGD